eukprot:scaffold1060_cov385-Pavlova_lutheri.AAC.26
MHGPQEFTNRKREKNGTGTHPLPPGSHAEFRQGNEPRHASLVLVRCSFVRDLASHGHGVPRSKPHRRFCDLGVSLFRLFRGSRIGFGCTACHS